MPFSYGYPGLKYVHKHNMSVHSIRSVLVSQHEAILALLDLNQEASVPVDDAPSNEPRVKGVYQVFMDNATECSDSEGDRNAVEYCCVEDVSAEHVTISWFYSASEPGPIPKAAWLAAPASARRGHWASNDCETWALEHFRGVVGEAVSSVSWTGFNSMAELNVTGMYDVLVPHITKRYQNIPVLQFSKRRGTKRGQSDI